jgi:predicted small lipoprotein YifL
MMNPRILKPVLALLLLAAATACGVKNDLLTPDGQKTDQKQNDPSRPQSPLGQ